jgi:DNA-binding transcriptional ArsR family regulator
VTAYQSIEALADPSRRSIFEQLGHGPRSVVELARGATISRPAVSQHLKVLKDAGLVRARPEGTRRIYSVSPDGLAAVRAYFEQFWTQALRDYARVASRPTEESS